MPVSMNPKDNYLLHAPIGPTLKKITTPMVIGIMTIMAFSLVDTFFISQLGINELAAIGFTYPVTFVVLNFMMGLSIGLNVVMARLLGKNDHQRARVVATNALTMSAIIVIIISAIGLATLNPLFQLLGASEEVSIHIRDYMIPWFLGVTMLGIPMVGNGAIRATGDMKTPAIIMIIAGLINGILDPLLIFGIGPFPELGMQGAALATVIAWLCSMLAALWVLIRKKKLLIIELTAFRQFKSSCQKVLFIGIPTAVSNMLVPLATGIVTAIVAQFGETAVAGFGVGARLEALSLVIAMALSASLTTFIGQNLGAQKHARVKEAIKTSIKFVLLLQLALYIFFLFTAPVIANIFTEDPVVRENIILYLQILPISYGLQSVVMIISAFMNSLHKPLTSLAINGMRLFLFYIPLSYLGASYAGYSGLLTGAMLSVLLASLLAIAILKYTYKSGFDDFDKKID